MSKATPSGVFTGLRPTCLTALMLLTLLLAQLLPVNSQAAEPRQVLTACGHPFYPPVSWVSDGQLRGLAPVITQQLFAELGYDIRLIADTNWKRCLREVRLGNIDIVVAAYRIASRESYLDYSQQYIIADDISLFVNQAAAPKISHLDDLPGKTVGLLLGDSFGDEFDAYLAANTHIEYVSLNQQNFTKLARQRIDFMPIGRRSGLLQTRKLGFENLIVPLAYQVTREYYYMGLGKPSQLSHHLPYINQRLIEMHRDHSLRRLIRNNSLEYLRDLPVSASQGDS